MGIYGYTSLLVQTPKHDPEKEDDIYKERGDPLDDSMDAFRYGLYTWIREPVKPKELLELKRIWV